jgi:hypothetical protein
MQATTSRPRPFLVASLIIVVLVALGGVTYYATAPKGARATSSTSSTLSTSSTTCGTVTVNTTDVSSTNCQLGLTFTLSIESGTIEGGENLTAKVSIRNDLPSNRNVTFTGTPTMHGGLTPDSPELGVYLLPSPGCSTNVSGYIAAYNSSDAPQQLNDDAPNLACGVSGLAGFMHQFFPYQTINQTLTLGGYYHSSDASEPWLNATYVQFTPGQQYAVAAFDGWGQLLTLNFTAP